MFDDLFWFAILLVFALGILSALMRLRERDKCLKFFDGQRVSYLGGRNATLWGRLTVVNKGLQLGFDRPLVNSRGLTKSSALMYESEYAACVGICRTSSGPNESLEADRQLQVQATFAPGRWKRVVRGTRNVLYTIRDAVSNALGAITGQISKTTSAGRAVSAPGSHVVDNATSMVEFIGNAYEQLLERLIGKPVVLELDPPPGSGTQALEISGYLVDYTDRFLAVFNTEHEATENHVLEFEGSRDDFGLRASVQARSLELTSRSDLPLVIDKVSIDGETTDLSIILLKGCSVALKVKNNDVPVRVEFSKTNTIDIVCPRATSRVRFGGDSEAPEVASGWSGIAPTNAANAEATR